VKLEPGTQLPDHTLNDVSAERMKTMAALLQDPNPIHIDAEVVRRLGLADRVINQGMGNLGPIINQLAGLGPETRLERLQVKFLGRVLAGDDMTASATVDSVTQAEPGYARVTCAVRLSVDGRDVVQGTAGVRTAAPST
jgi:acyl dehydratase